MNGAGTISIGVLNLMPDTVAYHRELLEVLDSLPGQVDVHWLKLRSKDYGAEGESFVSHHYRTVSDSLSSCRLDGLLVSGAPYELLAFDEVPYWNELRMILDGAVRQGLHSFGICWGALAIGHVLGLRKQTLRDKLSGLYATQCVASAESPLSVLPASCPLPFSIQARFDADDVERQIRDGRLMAVTTLPALGHAFVHTADLRHFMCLGHPEYGARRLVAEWHRDRRRNAAARPPEGIDVDMPVASWRPLSTRIFSAWIEQIRYSATADGMSAAPSSVAVR